MTELTSFGSYNVDALCTGQGAARNMLTRVRSVHMVSVGTTVIETDRAKKIQMLLPGWAYFIGTVVLFDDR